MAHPSQPFCLRCGSPIETGQRFCTHCGSTLDREANNPTAMPADRLFTPAGSPARNGLPLAPAFPAADGSTIVAPDSGPTPLRDTPAPPYAALPGSPDCVPVGTASHRHHPTSAARFSLRYVSGRIVLLQPSHPWHLHGAARHTRTTPLQGRDPCHRRAPDPAAWQRWWVRGVFPAICHERPSAWNEHDRASTHTGHRCGNPRCKPHRQRAHHRAGPPGVHLRQ